MVTLRQKQDLNNNNNNNNIWVSRRCQNCISLYIVMCLTQTELMMDLSQLQQITVVCC